MKALLAPSHLDVDAALRLCRARLHAAHPMTRWLAAAGPGLQLELAPLLAAWVLAESGEPEAVARSLQTAPGGEQRTPLSIGLSAVLSRRALDPMHLRPALNEITDAPGSFSNREELTAHTRRRIGPFAQLLAGLLAQTTSDRLNALAENLGVSIWWTSRLSRLGYHWRQGTLWIPIEDLSRFNVRLEDIDSCEGSEALRQLMAYEARCVLPWLQRGWALTQLLPAWRARLLALFLRRHAAVLGAMQHGRSNLAFNPDGKGLRPNLAISVRILIGLLITRCPVE